MSFESITSIQPKYRQVHDWIIEQIKSGNFADGTFLPSETELCKILKVGRITVRSAIEELNNKKIILKQQGRRSVINAKAITEKKRMRIAWLSKNGLAGLEEIHFQIYNHFLRISASNESDVVFVALQNQADIEWFIDQADSFDGIVLPGAITSRKAPQVLLEKLKSLNNYIVIDEVKKSYLNSYISTDNYLGGKMAAELFVKRGFSHPVIGIRAEEDSFEPIQRRVQGFCDYMDQNGVAYKKINLVWYNENFYNTQLDLKKFMDKNLDTDSFFCVNDYMAINLLFALKGMEIRVPEDVSVLGFDGIPRAEETFPGLSTIVQPTEKIAKEVFESFKQSTEDNAVKQYEIVIPPELKIRESVKLK